jgi:predicted Zn-dependent peptidase
MLSVLICFNAFAQQTMRDGFQEYKLENGMTVYLWVDKDMPDVYGQVSVRAGSIDEPEDFTGLAHYLEHELFKGTQQIGALNWEQEKPLYEEIIRLYDECAAAGKAGDKAKKDELIKKINEKSIEVAKISQDDDFPRLLQGIGGYGVNAYTNTDETAYHNYFPSYQMEKWLTIYYDRLVNPVFRSFQAELENVFEEYNMRTPSVTTQQYFKMMEVAFKGTPYARTIIGTVEHLKNPSMSPMIKFFNDWYVPNNMGLILVGNFDAEAVKPLIEKTFGKLQAKPLPERVPVKPQSFAGSPKEKVKLGYTPSITWVFDGIKIGHQDELKLDFAIMCLNNSLGTGLFDKLNIENTIGAVSASAYSLREMGRIVIDAEPYMDLNNGVYYSDKQTENDVMKEINKLKRGNIPSWLFTSVKDQYLRQIKIMAESPDYKANILNNAFVNNVPMDYYFTLEQKIKALTLDDVKEIAAKYFGDEYLTISWSEGDPKVEKLTKPDIKPLTERPDGQISQYALNFEKLPEGTIKSEYNDFSDVQHQQLYNGVDLYYTPNPKNDIFSLILEYGIGTHKNPKLEYAAMLMNYAGTMPNQTAQDLRRELGKYGASVGYGVNDNKFYIQVSGEEGKLTEILNIVTRQALMPKLDNRAIEGVLWSTVQSRMFEQRQSNVLTSALWGYVQYGNESPYIDRIPSKDLIFIGSSGMGANPLLTNTDLTTAIQDATSYAVKMYYCGQKPIAEVAKALDAAPIKKDMKPREQEYLRKRVEYKEPQIYFLDDANTPQAQIIMYIPIGDNYSKEDILQQQAFNEYFDGGFAGLVLHEIREKRSLAYGASGNATGSLKTKKEYFVGSVGTQNDKVMDVLATYTNLLKDMPLFPERIDYVKRQLKAINFASRYSFRDKAMALESLKEVGFTDDPAKYIVPQIDNLNFDDITNFYNADIKGKPLIIVICGDPKLIKIKEIQKKYGKVTKITKAKLFKGSEFYF